MYLMKVGYIFDMNLTITSKKIEKEEGLEE